MKKSGKIFASITPLWLLLNNVAYATTEVAEEEGDSPYIKIFMIIGAVVIALLLYLGYKMDTKGNEKPAKLKKERQKLAEKATEKAEEIVQNSGSYEADEVSYEEDRENLNNEDLNEKVEYNEDEEDSLFEVANEEDEEDEEDSIYGYESEEDEVELEKEQEDDGEGEEFDVSIIDNLDNEDEVKPSESTKTSEETMLFDSKSLEKSDSKEKLENEIDELDVMDEDMEANLKAEEEKDTFIDELKNFKEQESNFEGFSRASNVETLETEKEPKKYKRAKEDAYSSENISEDNEFLSQLDANFQQSRADREAKKNSSKSSTMSTTKKNTKKKD